MGKRCRVYQEPIYWQQAPRQVVCPPSKPLVQSPIKLSDLTNSSPKNFGLDPSEKYKEVGLYQVKINGEWHLALLDRRKNDLTGHHFTNEANVYTMPFAQAQELLKTNPDLWKNGAHLNWKAAPKELELEIKKKEEETNREDTSTYRADGDEFLRNLPEKINLDDKAVSKDETIEPKKRLAEHNKDDVSISSSRESKIEFEPIKLRDIAFSPARTDEVVIDRPNIQNIDSKPFANKKAAGGKHIPKMPDDEEFIDVSFAAEAPKIENLVSQEDLQWFNSKLGEGIKFASDFSSQVRDFEAKQERPPVLISAEPIEPELRPEAPALPEDVPENKIELKPAPKPVMPAKVEVEKPAETKQEKFTELKTSTEEFEIDDKTKIEKSSKGFIVNTNDDSFGLIYPNSDKKFTAFRFSYDGKIKSIALQMKKGDSKDKAWDEALKADKTAFLALEGEDINFLNDKIGFNLLEFLHNQKQEPLTKGLNQVLGKANLELNNEGIPQIKQSK